MGLFTISWLQLLTIPPNPFKQSSGVFLSFLGKKPFTLFECFTLDSFKVGSGLVRVDAKVEPIFVFIFIFGFVFVFIGT